MIYFKSGRGIAHDRYIFIVNSNVIRVYHRNYNVIVGKNDMNHINVSNMEQINITQVPQIILHKIIIFIFQRF